MNSHPSLAKISIAAAIASMSLTLSTSGFAQSDAPVYGHQLMTEEERAAHRRKMRNADTDNEREKICTEHRAMMAARAKEKGVDLPRKGPRRGKRRGWCHHRHR